MAIHMNSIQENYEVNHYSKSTTQPNRLDKEQIEQDPATTQNYLHNGGSQSRFATLKELTFIGVATTSGASGESLPANFSCMKRLSTID